MTSVPDPFDDMLPEDKRAHLSTMGLGIAVSPSVWRKRANELWSAAETLQSHYEAVFAHVHAALELDTPFQEPDARILHHGHIAAMLWAMSLECIVKAAWYSLEIQSKGHVAKADDPPGNHDVLGLLDKMGAVVDDRAREEIERIPVQLQIGRYPFAWVGKGKGQSMTISAYASPGEQLHAREQMLGALSVITNDEALRP